MSWLLNDLWGNTVSLSNERLTHLLEHPEMRSQEDKISETLLKPEMVIQSTTDETVKLFHRFYLNLSIGDKYLCVVVKYMEIDIFIITAYFTDRIKKGEVVWQK